LVDARCASTGGGMHSGRNGTAAFEFKAQPPFDRQRLQRCVVCPIFNNSNLILSLNSNVIVVVVVVVVVFFINSLQCDVSVTSSCVCVRVCVCACCSLNA